MRKPRQWQRKLFYKDLWAALLVVLILALFIAYGVHC